MNIFNSLGSNYSNWFVFRSLFSIGSARAKDQLKSRLGDYYGGQVSLTYKGRQALELALKSSHLPAGSSVGINGFTCYVVYQAVERAGYKAVFIDTAPGSLNFDSSGLKRALKENEDLRAIIVQNTLGLVAEMPEIVKFAKQNNILIIEDLAHSLGAVYTDGQETGKVGELVMLSFSQDKPLDVVAGGAFIDRRPVTDISQIKNRVSFGQRQINAIYPFWTALIRATYPIGLGRYIHFGLRKLRLLSTPMSDNLKQLSTIEPKAAGLLNYRWLKKDAELKHRLEIANIYANNLPKQLCYDVAANSKSSYLRFPIKVDEPLELINYLKKSGVYIGDTWYDAPIGPKRYLPMTSYNPGQCPNAEKLARQIVNLPTHIHVSADDAKLIAGKVTSWLKSTTN